MNYEYEIRELKNRIEKLEKLLIKQNEVEEVSKETKKRDTTRYMFKGKVYPKNRLVLAVIKDYCSNHPSTLNELQNIFNKSLQGSLNVVEDINVASKIKDVQKRYFTKSEDVLTLKNNITAVVCTQWGIFNIIKFIKASEKLGLNIEII